MAIITLANGAKYDTSTGQVVQGSYTFTNTAAAGGGNIVTGRTTQTAPAPVTPASDLVGLRPNPVTGQMTFSGSNPQTVQQVTNRYASMGYNVGQGDGTKTTATPVVDSQAEYYAKLERERRQNATAVMSALLESYNLTSLYNRVVGYIQDGYDADAIMALIRTTPEYKQRFPAMEALAKKGRAISESAYIEYEKTAAGLERRYGLPQNMLMGNVTKLLENEVSGDELNTRVLLASAASIQAPQEIKDALYQFYNVDSGGLTAYFLDPAIATPLLEKQYATAQIGAEAIRQNVGLDVGLAENLQSLGVTQQQAQQGFATVATQRDLTQGRGDIVTQRQQVQAVLGNDVQAQQDMQRAIGARVGRFEGGGEFLRTERGAVGLGTAETR